MKGVHNMKIIDVDERRGLSRSNVRFYEKKKKKQKFVGRKRKNAGGLQETKVMVIEIILKMMWKI